MRTFWPSAAFYPQWALITLIAAAAALRGRLTYDRLVAGSARLMRALERCGIRFQITGAETLSAGQGPFVFVCNHMSAMETQVLPAIIGRDHAVTFVVKPSLMRYPVFRRVLGAFHPIVVTRTDPRADLRQVLSVGKSRLQAGISVIIFPQAHRSSDFDPASFGSMGWRLAKAAGVPMVPIALSTEAWGRGAWVEDAGPIDPSKPARFAIGAPIPIGDVPAEAHRQAADFIAERLAAWSADQQ